MRCQKTYFLLMASGDFTYKFFIERFRGEKWRRTGIIWWNLVDGWPQISDAIVDYYYCKKLAYHFIKRSQEPVCLMISETKAEDLILVGANEYLEDKTVKYTVTDFADDKICETVLSLFPEPESISKEQDLKFLLSFLIKFCVDNLDLRGANMPEWLVLTLKEMEKTQNIKEGIPAMIEISNYSRSRLSKLIRKYLGISLHEYISGLRLEAAHKDIVLTDKSLEEIGESVGYLSFSHFQKIFKEKYGITPARLRNKYRSWTV